MDVSPTREELRPDEERIEEGVEETFQLLADETRLDILEALAGAHDSAAATPPLRFSELREHVGVDDPGRLNYHLNKLSTHFVRRTDDGYELREAGERIVRLLRSGAAIADAEIEPVAVDLSCWFCGGGTEFSYRDGWRYLACTECDARCVDSVAPGVLSRNEAPPSGLRNRTPDEIVEADRIWSAHRRASVMDEVCPECAGTMPVRSIDVCEDHCPDWDGYQYCEHCGSLFRTLVTHVCGVCGYTWRLPTLFYPTGHPAVVALFHEHGVELDLAREEQRHRLLTFREELLSADPLRIQITVPVEEDELRLTFDELMNVVDVTR